MSFSMVKIPLNCKDCNFSTFYHDDLKLHMKIHPPLKSLSCKICGHLFKHSYNVKRHMRIHTKEVKIPLNCKDCNFSTFYQDDLKLHMKIHPPLKSLYCKICGHLFKHSYSVKRHMRIHTKEAPYKCTECDYTCRRSEYLKAHKKKHGQSNGLSTSVPLRCKVCPFTTDNKVLFTSHLDIHTKEQPKGDECDSSATKLLLGLSYNEAKTYKCKLCDYATDKKGNFVVHFRIHTGEKPYKCTMCGFTFKQLVHLKRHVRNHNKDDLFGCSICDYRTGEGKELDSHIKTHCGFVQFFLDELQYNSSDIHSNSSDMLFVENTTPGKKCTKTKLHKCIYCDYMTNQTGNLKRHQKTHFKDVPEKPISVNAVSVKVFDCPECPFKASRKHQMEIHMRSHNGKSLYECNLCDYKTVNKFNLSRHQKTHTFGEMSQFAGQNGKPLYECHLCDYKTVNKSIFSRHQKTHHWRNQYGN